MGGKPFPYEGVERPEVHGKKQCLVAFAGEATSPMTSSLQGLVCRGTPLLRIYPHSIDPLQRT